MSTIPPATWSVRAFAPRGLAKRPSARAVGAGVAVGALLFAGAWTFASPSAAAPRARALVSVGASDGASLDAAEVYVDGILECQAVPCSIDLEPGLRQIEVRDPSQRSKSVRVVDLQQSERTALHFVLPSTASAVATRPAPADGPIAVTSLPLEASGTVAPAEPPRTRTEAVASRSAAPAVAFGVATLNLNSIPISNVVLDGRPMGSTPLLGVQVSAGRHVVTFVHPELGRRSAPIEVEAGQRRAVVVRFPAADDQD